VKVVVFSVEAFMALLNVALTVVVMEMLAASLAGIVEATTGAVSLLLPLLPGNSTSECPQAVSRNTIKSSAQILRV